MDSTSDTSSTDQNRRSRSEIMASLLILARKGETRSTLAERARLNNRQSRKYMAELINLGLVETRLVNGKRIYSTSQKGNQYLREYRKLRGILS